MSLGRVMLDVEGTTLSVRDRELLAHPAVGGVILFARNYQAPEQLRALVADIHAVRQPALLVAVDQEGGRVQRFRHAFSALPALAVLGDLHDAQAAEAVRLAEVTGFVLAAELRACGIDFSFAPVLDLRNPASSVIADRAFHRDPEVVAALGRAMMRGLREAGMTAVGKHFPGHGNVSGDSHHTLPIDPRSLETLRFEDLLAFERMVHFGLAGIMPAHVVYPEVDCKPAGFSRRWLHDVLRVQFGFNGTIFSDDLCMAGAAHAGDVASRARAAVEAGCDMVLVCNDRGAAERVVDAMCGMEHPVTGARLARMHGRGEALGLAMLDANQTVQAARSELRALVLAPELGFDDGNELA